MYIFVLDVPSPREIADVLECTTPEVKPMLQLLTTHQLTAIEDTATAKVLRVLASDASVTDFLPPKIADLVLTAVREIGHSIAPAELTQQLIQVLKRYCVELADLLYSACHNGIARSEALSLVRSIAQRSAEIAEGSTPPAPAVRIENTYNPAMGEFYSFTDHGCRVRNPRKSELDKDREKKTAEYDDPPTEKCSKKYPVVQKKGECSNCIHVGLLQEPRTCCIIAYFMT